MTGKAQRHSSRVERSASAHFFSSSSFCSSSTICARRAWGRAITSQKPGSAARGGAARCGVWQEKTRGAAHPIPCRRAGHAHLRLRPPAGGLRHKVGVVTLLTLAEGKHVRGIVHALLAHSLLPELGELHIVHVVLPRHPAAEQGIEGCFDFARGAAHGQGARHAPSMETWQGGKSPSSCFEHAAAAPSGWRC